MRNVLARTRKPLVALVIAFAVMWAPTQASAAECRVDRENYGPGWVGAYFCYGSEMITPRASTCIVENGNYVLVTVTCDVVAVVYVD